MESVISRIRQPEYTGVNRCLPCTVVNLVIGLGLAALAALAAVALEASALALPLAGGVILVSVLAIYFRGYLVPGTPSLTKRYFPTWLLQWFGKAEATGVERDTEVADGDESMDPEELLSAAGALEPCEDVDDLCLTDSFAEEWKASIERTRESGTDRERLLRVLGAEDLDPEFNDHGNSFWARANNRRLGKWESRAAFIADVAAAPLLEERLDRWEDMSVPARGRLLNGLRLFLEVCPDCGDELTFETDTVESCCSTHDVAAVSCRNCGARLFESDPL